MLYVRDVSCAGGAGGRGRDVGRERTREEGMWVVGGTAEGGWAMGGGSGELRAAGVCPARAEPGFEYGVGDAGAYGCEVSGEEGGGTRIGGECFASGGEGEGANGVGQLIKGRQLPNGEWLQGIEGVFNCTWSVGSV